MKKQRISQTIKWVCLAVCMISSLTIFSDKAFSAETGKKVEVVIIIADNNLDDPLIRKIIAQNPDVTMPVRVTGYKGPLDVFLRDPDGMSMATLARYDSEHNTNYLENEYVTVNGNTANTEYIMIKAYGK